MESVLQGTSVTLSEINFDFCCQCRELFKYVISNRKCKDNFNEVFKRKIKIYHLKTNFLSKKNIFIFYLMY